MLEKAYNIMHFRQKHYKTIRLHKGFSLVRDQEAGGSNPLAPTIIKGFMGVIIMHKSFFH